MLTNSYFKKKLSVWQIIIEDCNRDSKTGVAWYWIIGMFSVKSLLLEILGRGLGQKRGPTPQNLRFFSHKPPHFWRQRRFCLKNRGFLETFAYKKSIRVNFRGYGIENISKYHPCFNSNQAHQNRAKTCHFTIFSGQ